MLNHYATLDNRNELPELGSVYQTDLHSKLKSVEMYKCISKIQIYELGANGGTPIKS